MSTATTAPQHPQHAEASAPADRSGLGVILGLVGGALLLVSGLLSWSYEPIFGDISIRFWPVSLQIFAMLLGITVLVVALSRSLLAPVLGWFSAGRGRRRRG